MFAVVWLIVLGGATTAFDAHVERCTELQFTAVFLIKWNSNQPRDARVTAWLYNKNC